MTVGDALARGTERLQTVSTSPRIDAVRLLDVVSGRNVAWLFAHADAQLEPHDAARFEALLERRAVGEPLAYIVGDAGFYGRTFSVSPAVLVPRPESEHIVELALEGLRSRRTSEPVRICDVGTGSGSLAVTLALELPDAHVVAIDVSPDALAVAAQNASALGAESRIRFVLGDLFESLEPDERFDCIVANLPYVATAELARAPAPTSFEPRLALDGGRDGLEAYRRLLAGVPDRLIECGRLLMEAGPDTAQALAVLTQAAFGPASDVNVAADYAARERIVSVRRRA
ncbi:MAG: peptide chain release factor N(5)-glutamine methyltransferase [Candidatus Eremiobacteraeota bacterium]|nr:peptide chain release factor N(5)-glutamine methyltransferase [Candidatus Eremiobacteraeota bacterium]